VLERYEAALAGLSETDQELLHLRIELDFDYKEIAEMTGRQKADTARVAVHRALARLANGMHREA
jgi:DNA-directed RNA polymerase specialized sigma24 family protein